MSSIGGNINDVWATPYEESTLDVAPPPVARTNADAASGGPGDAVDAPPPPPPIAAADPNATIDTLRELLEEARRARVEATRWHRVSAALGCLAVALVLAYMDRLRAHLRLQEMQAARGGMF